jgi:hypothetical protein
MPILPACPACDQSSLEQQHNEGPVADPQHVVAAGCLSVSVCSLQGQASTIAAAATAATRTALLCSQHVQAQPNTALLTPAAAAAAAAADSAAIVAADGSASWCWCFRSMHAK